MAATAAVLAARPSVPGEVVVEAGCWYGGSTAKLSLLCALQGFKLCIFDSFRGVEPMKPEPGAHDYSGEYSASEELVRSHVMRFGHLPVCEFYPGWFADTLAKDPITRPVRMVYIDCDVVKGTQEVLCGVRSSLVADAVIFSQDFHIKPVRRYLVSDEAWGERMPTITIHARRLVSFKWDSNR